MIYNKINLMLPTYGRHDTKLPKFIDSALDMADDVGNLFFTFCCNKKDADTVNFIESRLENMDYEILVEDSDKVDLARYFNLMYDYSIIKDHYSTVVSLLGDDMIFQTKGWDRLILDEINYYDGTCVVYGNDCLRAERDLCTNLFTTRKLVDATECKFMAPEFPIDMIDEIWQRVGEDIGRMVYLEDVKIYHDHASRPNNMDAVWRRMRKNHKKVGGADPDAIVKKRVDNIKKNLKHEFESEIDVIMTTYNRVDLLRRTVSSYNNSASLPDKIEVFDDRSNEQGIGATVGLMRGATFIGSESHLKCWYKTPDVLGEKFKSGSKAVFIIDSDTEFDPHWWTRLNVLYRGLKDDENFGCISLFNQSSIKPLEKCSIPGLVTKPVVGAFGCLITKEFWEKFIEPFDHNPSISSGWDHDMSHAATKAGKKVYCTSPSFLQHIGYSKGTHADKSFANPAIADDFRGEIKFDTTNTVNDKNGKDILWCLCGRIGDIIQGSMVANQLIDLGYKLTWLTITTNVSLVKLVCPGATVRTINEVNDTETEWGYMDTYSMKNKYPNNSFFINAQFGSPENHYHCTHSAKHPLVWLKERVEGIIGDVGLDDNWLSHLKLAYRKEVLPEYYEFGMKDIAIIAPDALTSNAITEELAEKRYEELSEKYHVRFLVKELPDDCVWVQIREKYCFRISIEECIFLLINCKHYVGNDSGLSWASLYSDCTKEIYHNKDRISIVNTYFSQVDPKAKDIII